MFKLLFMITPIIKEFVFDRNKEMKARKQKPKAFVYAVIFLIVATGLFATERLFVVSNKAVGLVEENAKLKQDMEGLKRTIDALTMSNLHCH